MTTISNTTPLINFAAIGLSDLFPALFGEITIPPAVDDELRPKTQRFPQLPALLSASFIKTAPVTNRLLVTTLQRQIHSGEAECIALALDTPGSRLLLDDVAARDIARYHRLPFTGTLGCLIQAKRVNLLAIPGPELISLLRQQARFWLHPQLERQFLETYA